VITETGGNCAGCDPDFYASQDRLTCLACPANTQSPAGSLAKWQCTAKAGFFARYTKTVKFVLDVPAEDADPSVMEAYVRAAVGDDEDVQVRIDL
jgi:hypothetical protein